MLKTLQETLPPGKVKKLKLYPKLNMKTEFVSSWLYPSEWFPVKK
jgi:hypothetical protein